ncbi:phospholipase effector Tle1 domain-containing protein [Salinimonas chungwhensis]|uniref:phospholipase effector Tle1 domain-containing protein n=1 Tax=Salinimonas chungwhensis TaxID=265425 RepID=UPI00036BB1C5|nr:DUF2235 domain-containing protein [Salinimonas chungwhensis]
MKYRFHCKNFLIPIAKIKLLNRSLLLIMAFMLCGCSSIFSGNEALPIPMEERYQLDQAKFFIEAPDLRLNPNKKNIKYYVAAFDGTENDKDNLDENSRETVVSYLYSILDKKKSIKSEYYPGPGTQKNYITRTLDSVRCHSCIKIANKALEDFETFIKKEERKNDNLEIKVITIGFSRGAAIARHFMNQLSKQYKTSLLDDRQEPNSTLIRTIGLLFDTVATSVEDELELGISTSTDFLLHFIANNESRRLFPVIYDVDIDFPGVPGRMHILQPRKCKLPTISNSNRLAQLSLPGSHSDIGASYKSGIGTYYRIYGEIALLEMGLISKTHFEIDDYLFTSGKHDSRGLYDFILESIFGKNSRGIKKVRSVKLSQDEYKLAKRRLSNQFNSNFGYTSELKEIKPVVIDLKKEGDYLKFYRGYFGLRDLQFSNDKRDGKRVISFTYDESDFISRMELNDKVWNSIPENELSRLEFILLESEEIERGYYYVDCKMVYAQ